MSFRTCFGIYKKMLKQVQHDNKGVIASDCEAIQPIEAPHPAPPRSRGGKKFAFTLAEVLITLGIIGVVAAMTIPTLMTKIQIHQLRHQLKQTYSELNQLALLFKEDHEMSISEWANVNGNLLWSDPKELPKYWKGFTKISDWSYLTSSTVSLPYPVKSVAGYKSTAFGGCDSSGLFTDLRGRTIMFDDAPFAGYNGPRVCVDINGSAGPNRHGMDIFNFLFTVDGHVIPEGQGHLNNDYTSPQYSRGTLKADVGCVSPYTGGSTSLTCAYYAVSDKSPKGNGTYWDDFIGKKQYK